MEMKKKLDTELKELGLIAAKSHGVLQPLAVIKYARNENTALHKHFDWDDSIAGAKWRLEQARHLIRVTVMMIQPSGGQEQSIRAYVSLTSDRYKDGGGYRATTTVLSDKDMRAQLLADALSELIAFKTKYAMLKELAGVFDAIQAIPQPQKALPLPRKEVKNDHRRKESLHMHV